MTTLEEIKQAVKQLSPNDVNEFNEWFTQYYNGEAWDASFAAAAAAGKFDAMIAAALEEYRNGTTTEL
jgi:hypothetical protein